MTSSDVENLFTNNPLDEIIEKLYKQPFLMMIQFTVLSKKISKNFSNLHPMSHFSHLITNIISNEMVSPWDSH